jgi:hypothetical protein
MKENKMHLVGIVACAFFITACAATSHTHKYDGGDASCIASDFAKLDEFYSKGAAHIDLREIDGEPVARSKNYCMAPGQHTIGLWTTNKGRIAQSRIEMTLAPGKQYQLKSTRIDDTTFSVEILDTSNQQMTQVATFPMQTTSTLGPLLITIPATGK